MSDIRDFCMARLAAAKIYCIAASEAIDAALEHFVDPSDDPSGALRKEALEAVSDNAGEVSRSVELAQSTLEDMGPEDFKEDEPESEEDADE